MITLAVLPVLMTHTLRNFSLESNEAVLLGSRALWISLLAHCPADPKRVCAVALPEVSMRIGILHSLFSFFSVEIELTLNFLCFDSSPFISSFGRLETGSSWLQRPRVTLSRWRYTAVKLWRSCCECSRALIYHRKYA